MLKNNNTVQTLIRLIIYGLFMVGLNQIFWYDALHYSGENKFGENSFTEILQEILLFLTFLIFLWAGIKEKSYRAFTNLVALFFLSSFIREFNNMLEHWFYFVLVVLALSSYLFIRDFRKFWTALERFLSISASSYLLIGFITTYVFSRFFGRTSFWKIVMDSSYTRDAKNAGEECIELLGYTLLFIAGIELLIAIRQQKKKITEG